MRPVTGSNEIQETRLLRKEGCFDGCETWVADWPWGKPCVEVRVVATITLVFLASAELQGATVTVTDPDGYRWVLATFKKLAPFS